jgi:hypothetical protein
MRVGSCQQRNELVYCATRSLVTAAAQIFDIELEASAVAAGIDGRFRSGSLQGRTANINWYPKREGLLDTTDSTALDYYLVLTGPPSAAAS